MSKLTTLSQVSDVANAVINKVKDKGYSVGTYTIKKQAQAETDYAHTYQLFNVVGEGATAVETAVGEKINIPKDMVVQSATVETVTTTDVPYQGAVVGDKYIDMVIANSSGTHVYIPVNDLFNEYSAGNGIDITNSAIAIKIDSTNANGLSATSNGLKLDTATTSTPGAMAAADKTKLDGLSNYDDTAVNNAMVRADSPDADGFSQLYKMVNGQRVNIDPKTSGGNSTPYTYMTVDEYLEITPEADKLYWVINTDGEHGVYKNGSLVEGKDVAINNPWVAIQNLVRAGTFANTYSVGDQFTIRYNGNDTLWDVVAIDVAIPADNTKTHSVTLMPHNCLESLMFDNKEPNNSDSNRKSYGNNRYLYSNIRQWLNSSAAAGSWYSNQHSADAAPDYATTKAGFMSYFDSEFLAVIGKTKIKTVKASVDGGSYEEMADEYFYLPSTTEVGLANESSIAEGTLFPYFDSNEKRIKQYSGSNKWWWLRTPHSGVSSYVRGVSADGSLSGGDAGNSFGVAPACNII